MSTKKDGRKNQSPKKEKNKKILIMSLVGFGVLVLLIGGYFLFKTIKKNAPIKEDWGQTYYVYLKDKKEKTNEEAILPDEAQEAKLKLYEVKDVEKPVMTIEYNVKEEHYTNVYYIVNNQVNTIIYNEPTNIVFLYNIEDNEYHYYFHIEAEEEEYYESLSTQIKDSLANESSDNKIAQEPEYTFKKGEEEKITNANGEEITVSKFEEVFVIPEVEENEGIDFNPTVEDEELKDMISSSIENYETTESIVTDEVKNDVEVKVNDVTKRQEEIQKIKEEQERAKKEIEELFTQLRGVWIEENGGLGNLCIDFDYKNNKKWMIAGWLGSEGYFSGYITNIKSLGNEVYEFTIGSKKWEFDLSELKNKKMKIGNVTYTYIAKTFDSAYEKLAR